jgi:hypothetical protein
MNAINPYSKSDVWGVIICDLLERCIFYMPYSKSSKYFWNLRASGQTFPSLVLSKLHLNLCLRMPFTSKTIQKNYFLYICVISNHWMARVLIEILWAVSECRQLFKWEIVLNSNFLMRGISAVLRRKLSKYYSSIRSELETRLWWLSLSLVGKRN